MNKKLIVFATQLLGVLVLLAVLHVGFLYARSFDMPIDQLVLGYAVNFILAVVIYYALLRIAEHQSKNLGFLFLFGSTLKFAVYFLIFDPLFSQDGSLSKLEFFTFFIPYFACLITETLALVKLLKEID